MTRIPFDGIVDRVAFCDPASSKKGSAAIKRTRARSAIIVLGQDLLTRIFVLHAWAERCSTDKLIDTIFDVNEQFRPKPFGGEKNGLQGLFQDAVEREARYRNKVLPLQQVEHSTRIDKDFRIRAALQPVIAAGRLFVQDSQVELLTEITSFPRYPTKDLIDALASAVTLLPTRTIQRQRDDHVEQVAHYLRQSGAPPDVIARRVAELQSGTPGVRR